MQTVKKNVYYCDHCKKRSLSGGHMRSHEAHCTANPNRVCRNCGVQKITTLIDEFRNRFTLKERIVYCDPFGDGDDHNQDSHEVIWTGEPVTLKEVMDAVDSCPVCTLAILRQVGFNRHFFHFEEFRFKDLLARWREDNNPEVDYYPGHIRQSSLSEYPTMLKY